MIRLEFSRAFQEWRQGLRDPAAKSRIAARLFALGRGHWGDVKPVGGGVSELRIHHGPGYRLYLTKRGPTWVVLLFGGDKGSQSRDIAKAKALSRELNDGA